MSTKEFTYRVSLVVYYPPTFITYFSTMDYPHIKEQRIAELHALRTELHRRCDKKEAASRIHDIEIARLKERVSGLEEGREQADFSILSLTSWKNKAIGYLAAIATLAGVIIEYVREQF